ncbi:KCNMB2 [Branchiostoma lanceolatum]|uniref:KCNMB2 protein n=1 Tax=Branchiostoma lanceolatum TaxID=7740 RepID=A0A8J9YMP1_BRALA|nr:KCNMB2 [Branchiostoma lanceolatum]
MDERHRQAAVGQYKMYKCLVIVAALVTAGCMAALIVCGVTIVKPIVETNSLEFKETTCTTTRGYLTVFFQLNFVVGLGEDVDCGCGKNCQSSYPCLRMTVSYAGKDGSTYSGVLFDTEQRLNKDGHRGEDLQCVTAPCDRSREENRKEVEGFLDTHAAGQTYKCLYNPDDTKQVLLKRLFAWGDMFHSMLWSTLGFVIFAGITVYLALRCKAITSGAQPGPVHPPPYPGRQDPYPKPLQMQPPHQDPYKTSYSTHTNKGFMYN